MCEQSFVNFHGWMRFKYIYTEIRFYNRIKHKCVYVCVCSDLVH